MTGVRPLNAATASVHDPSPAGAHPFALQATGLSKRYRWRGAWALRDIDLAVPRGTITALVGPNGAGKSTLIRTWMGFERPTRGSVRVGGIDPRADRSGALRQLGYVSQSTALYRGLTVAHHLVWRQGCARGSTKTRLAPAWKSSTSRSPAGGVLSGGQAAQVALCLALGTRAPVLLLDEPLASLDPLARHDFLNIVASAVREQGTTVLLSSHIVSDVAAVCDQLVVVGLGHVTLQAPIRDAVEGHRLMPAAPQRLEALVAMFARPGGEPPRSSARPTRASRCRRWRSW